MRTGKMIWALLVLLLLTPLWTSAEDTEPGDPTVTYLNLDGQRLNYSTVKDVLAGYPGLEKADMYDIPLLRTQAEELEALYPGIEFGWTLKIGRDHEVRTDVTAFSTLHRSGSPTHTTREIAVLRYCKNLKALDFGHNGVDDLSWLTDLPDLRVLIIAVNRVTDITPLASLTKLEYLELFNNQISDLTPLKGLTHLMDLNISFNRITDLSPLYEMTWLRRLWLFNCSGDGTGIPAETIETLKKRLPNCQIDYRSRPTLGGWRDHPHYQVIHEMFEKSEYIPFSDSFPEFMIPEEDDEEDEDF